MRTLFLDCSSNAAQMAKCGCKAVVETNGNDVTIAGKLHYFTSGHYIIMGFDDMVPSIITHIFEKDKGEKEITSDATIVKEYTDAIDEILQVVSKGEKK